MSRYDANGARTNRRTFNADQGVVTDYGPVAGGVEAGTYYIHFVTYAGARYNEEDSFSVTVTEYGIQP